MRFITAPLIVLGLAACGGPTAQDLCARAGATGAALQLDFDDGASVDELFLDARVVSSNEDERTYTFARGLGRLVLRGEQVLSFSLPLRSGAVIRGGGPPAGPRVTDGLVEAEVETDVGRARLIACLPAR